MSKSGCRCRRSQIQHRQSCLKYRCYRSCRSPDLQYDQCFRARLGRYVLCCQTRPDRYGLSCRTRPGRCVLSCQTRPGRYVRSFQTHLGRYGLSYRARSVQCGQKFRSCHLPTSRIGHLQYCCSQSCQSLLGHLQCGLSFQTHPGRYVLLSCQRYHHHGPTSQRCHHPHDPLMQSCHHRATTQSCHPCFRCCQSCRLQTSQSCQIR